jgi:putative hydrolase of the HAD superfamily
VLFDMGNTLLEFETVPWEELNRRGAAAVFDVLGAAAAKAGIERAAFVRRFDAAFARWESAAAETHDGLHLFDVFADILHELGHPRDDRALVEAMTARHYHPIVDQVSLYPEVASTLAELRRAGKKLGIVSNTIWPSAYPVADLERFGILPHFDAVVFSTDVGVSKPHPRIFESCLVALRVPAARAVFVGDRPFEDVSGAQRVGMRGVLKSHPQRTPLPTVRPDALIDSLAELLPLVLGAAPDGGENGAAGARASRSEG